MRKAVTLIACSLGALFLGSASPPPLPSTSPAAPAAPAAPVPPAATFPPISVPAVPPMAELPPPPPPTPREALADGVLVVVSLPAQRMYVFRDGELWDSSRVSTGRRGHETPVGTFPILQKKVHHRSNLYNDAPMPFMQRLTWDGVALHAGHVPGYPASHGCIRLPRAFAQKLYKVTGFSSTIVVVTDEKVDTPAEALKIV